MDQSQKVKWAVWQECYIQPAATKVRVASMTNSTCPKGVGWTESAKRYVDTSPVMMLLLLQTNELPSKLAGAVKLQAGVVTFESP